MENTNKLEDILRKVKGLLNLSNNNPSQAEAQSAALKAQELIAKYNLNLSDVEKERLEISTSEYKTGIDKSWKYLLAQVIADNFRVMVYWTGRRIAVFYGYKQDTTIAAEVFEYLFKICEKGARAAQRVAYKERGTTAGVYFSYTRGFIIGVEEALDAQTTALKIIIPEEVKKSYVEHTKTFHKLSDKTRDGSEYGISRKAYYKGLEDGKSSIKSKNNGRLSLTA